MQLLVNLLEFILSKLYQNRPFARFYLLETIARVPYFSYLSVLHLYESMGAWKHTDWLKIHFAQSWNELHHLRIIESQGGNEFWLDRLLSRILVFIYYWLLVFVYMIAPRRAYHFNQLIEEKAFEAYDTFLKDYEDELKTKPAPQIAIDYYENGDLYMFDEFQSSQPVGERRPHIETLYDVFVAIRNDERQHINTMIACQRPDAKEILISPHSRQVQ